MLINRDFYLQQLINKKENGRVKVITGIRRSGKSYLLFKLYRDYLLAQGIKEEQIISLDLGDANNLAYLNPFKLNDYLKEQTVNQDQMYYIFIDEIQLCKAVANPYIEGKAEKITFFEVLLGLMARSNLDVYVIGNNSKTLFYDPPTQFRDRGDKIWVYPLSFKEVYDFCEDKALVFEQYAIYGGMPDLYHLTSEAEKSQYLKDLWQETYLEDILERNNIQNEREILEILLDFISSDIGSLTNPSKLASRFLAEKQIKISSHTIAKYLGFFVEAQLIYCVNRYHIKRARYFSTPLKYYFADIGLRNARLDF